VTECHPFVDRCAQLSGSLACCPGRTKQGETYTSSGICNGLQITGFPREAGQRDRGKSLSQHCAVLSMRRASPGWPLSYAILAALKPRAYIRIRPCDLYVAPLVTRQTHAFDPRTDLQRAGKQIRSSPANGEAQMKLKPCPFCGGTRIKTRRLSEMLGCPPHFHGYFKECEGCHACGPFGVRPSSAGAVWNNRAGEPNSTDTRAITPPHRDHLSSRSS
jgi:hypothetical protein